MIPTFKTTPTGRGLVFRSLLLATLLISAGSAGASLIADFDTLADGQQLPSSYQGFEWSWSGAAPTASLQPASGLGTALAVPGADELRVGLPGGARFLFDGAHLRGDLTIDYYLGGVLIGTQSVSAGDLSVFTANPYALHAVDTVVFNGTGADWILDDFTDAILVPEMNTWVFMTPLLIPIGLTFMREMRRRRPDGSRDSPEHGK